MIKINEIYPRLKQIAELREEDDVSTRNDDPFWEMVEGRRLGPPCSRFFGWTCLEIDPDKGAITVAFDPQPECLNPAGGIAGGFLAEMLDETASSAVKATLSPQEFPTAVELKVNFLRPAPLGRLIGHAAIVHRGGSIVFVESELRTPDNQLIATSSQTVRIARIKNVVLDFGEHVS